MRWRFCQTASIWFSVFYFLLALGPCASYATRNGLSKEVNGVRSTLNGLQVFLADNANVRQGHSPTHCGYLTGILLTVREAE